MSRYSIGRRDDNERPIIDALEAAGCAVWQMGPLEICDLLVLEPDTRWHPGGTYLLEVKNPDKPLSKRKLTTKQAKAKQSFPIHVVETVAQALQVCRGGV